MTEEGKEEGDGGRVRVTGWGGGGRLRVSKGNRVKRRAMECE